MEEVTVLAEPEATGEGWPPEMLDVTWRSLAPPLPPAARAHLEDRWSAYVAEAEAQGRTLYNGSVTYLMAAAINGERLELLLAPSDYKTFVVTALRDRAWFEAHAPRAIARALGVSALVTCRDGALLGVRSSRVSAYAGRTHLFGGVLDLQGAAATSRGIVEHLRAELNEELGAPAEVLTVTGRRPRLLGLVRDEFLGQPELVWQWEVDADLVTLGRGVPAEEHTGCMIMRRNQVGPGEWERMTPVARYAWRAWRGRS